MCVIAICSTSRPTETHVEKMFGSNPEGAGVAWREAIDGVPHVRWKKGLDLEQAQKLIAEVPIPFIAHFRIASVGGPSRQLCHPFPVREGAELLMEGQSTTPVLFHNGTWGAWKHQMFESTIKGNKKVPIGKWSDSRAMAWLAHHHGLGILEFLDEKIAIIGPHERDIQAFGLGWTVEDNIYVSNRGWISHSVSRKSTASSKDEKEEKTSSQVTPRVVVPMGPVSQIGRTSKYGSTGGSTQATPFRRDADRIPASSRAVRDSLGDVRRGQNLKEPIQEGTERVAGEATRGGASDQDAPAYSHRTGDGATADGPCIANADSLDIGTVDAIVEALSINVKKYRSGGSRIIPFRSDEERSARAKDVAAGRERIGPL